MDVISLVINKCGQLCVRIRQIDRRFGALSLLVYCWVSRVQRPKINVKGVES
jgi:hypothetical protein